MTNEKLLTKLYDLKTDHAAGRFEAVTEKLNNIIGIIESEIVASTAKAENRGNVLKLAQKILKQAGKGYRESLKYAYTDPKTKYQYICDSYTLLKLKNPLSLPELPRGISPINYENVLDYNKKINLLTLPDASKLKAYIKIRKAQKEKTIIYDFGAGFPIVNAESLYNILEAFPGATAYANQYNTALIFNDDNENTVLLMALNAKAYQTREKTNL